MWLVCPQAIERTIEVYEIKDNDLFYISSDFDCYKSHGSATYLIFHRGSEAWLDTYTTLGHMDIMIRKVLENRKRQINPRLVVAVGLFDAYRESFRQAG